MYVFINNDFYLFLCIISVQLIILYVRLGHSAQLFEIVFISSYTSSLHY